MNEWDRFKAACTELEAWLESRLRFHGIKYECVPESPNTIEELREAGSPIPVPEYRGRPDTIYSEGCNKCKYQAYHDHFHQLVPDWDFTQFGEYKIALDHMREAADTGLSDDAQRLLWVESYVRVAYYFKWNRFPRNEGLFHWLCWTKGIHAGLSAADV